MYRFGRNQFLEDISDAQLIFCDWGRLLFKQMLTNKRSGTFCFFVSSFSVFKILLPQVLFSWGGWGKSWRIKNGCIAISIHPVKNGWLQDTKWYRVYFSKFHGTPHKCNWGSKTKTLGVLRSPNEEMDLFITVASATEIEEIQGGPWTDRYKWSYNRLIPGDSSRRDQTSYPTSLEVTKLQLFEKGHVFTHHLKKVTIAGHCQVSGFIIG